MDDLPRTLSAWRGTAMMLNIVLGAGLLTLPGLAAAAVGDVAPVIWGLCALAAAPLLAVFAIMGRRWPESGGIATILSKSFGDFGYVSGTLLFLGAVVFGLPAIALAGGYYLEAAIGGSAPAYAAGLVLAAAAVNFAQAEIAGRINAFLAAVLIVALTGVIVLGWSAAPMTLPDIEAVWRDLPALSIIGSTAMMVFFAFTGWEVAAHLGGDFRDPKRDMPIAMAASFMIVVVLYIALALVVVGLDLGAHPEAPFAALFAQTMGPPGLWAITALSVLMIFANLAAAIWAVARMVYAAAGESVLPAALGLQRRGMPVRAVTVTVATLLGVILVTWAGAIDLSQLLAMAGQNFLLLYAGVAAVLIRLPRNRSERFLGWACVAIAGALLTLRGPEGLAYPAVLLLAAGAVTNYRCAREWDARRVALAADPSGTNELVRE